MAADDCLRLHNDQNLSPPGPDPAQGRPEQPVKLIQPRTRLLPLEHGDLLPQGENLNCSAVPTEDEDSDSGREGSGEFEHEPRIVTWRNAIPRGRR